MQVGVDSAETALDYWNLTEHVGSLAKLDGQNLFFSDQFQRRYTEQSCSRSLVRAFVLLTDEAFSFIVLYESGLFEEIDNTLVVWVQIPLFGSSTR